MLIDDSLYLIIQEHLPIACVDLLIKYNGKILLLRRDNEPAKGEFWFPGGRILKNETIRTAALRKAKEETNLNCQFEKIISVEESLFKKRNLMRTDIHTINVCCLLTANDLHHLRLDEFHSDYKWIDKIDSDYHEAVINPLLLFGFMKS